MLYPLLELIVLIIPIKINYFEKSLYAIRNDVQTHFVNLQFTKLYKISKKVNWWYFSKNNSNSTNNTLFSHARYKLVFSKCYESRFTIYGDNDNDKLHTNIKIVQYIEGIPYLIQELNITQFAEIYIKPYRIRLDKTTLSQFIQISKSINKKILYNLIFSI